RLVAVAVLVVAGDQPVAVAALASAGVAQNDIAELTRRAVTHDAEDARARRIQPLHPYALDGVGALRRQRQLRQAEIGVRAAGRRGDAAGLPGGARLLDVALRGLGQPEVPQKRPAQPGPAAQRRARGEAPGLPPQTGQRLRQRLRGWLPTPRL